MSDTNKKLPKKVKRNITLLDYLCYRFFAFVITAILISCTIAFFGPEDQAKKVSLLIMQNGILLVSGVVFAIMECSYSKEVARYEKEKESVAKEWEMQTISSEHHNGGGTGRGSWEYYERKNPTLDDSQPLNNKQEPREYLT